MSTDTRHLTRPQTPLTLSDKERHLILQLRVVPFGLVEIVMHNGQPDRIQRIKESIKL